MPTTSYDDAGTPTVEFRLPPEAGLERAWLCGEFNTWSTDSTPLRREPDGSLVTSVALEPGTYRFRYYLGDGDWENDWAADAYVDNEHGGQDSVVVVPPAPAPPPPVGDAPVEPVPAEKQAPAVKKAPAARKAPAAKKAPAKKAVAKKAAGVKKASKKQAPPPG